MKFKNPDKALGKIVIGQVYTSEQLDKVFFVVFFLYGPCPLLPNKLRSTYP